MPSVTLLVSMMIAKKNRLIFVCLVQVCHMADLMIVIHMFPICVYVFFESQ